MLFTEKESPSEIWKSLIQELEKGYLEADHPFRYATLGTIGAKGPEIRKVVLREFEKVLDFYVFTDFRSEKVNELHANPFSSLHFYHPKKRVQVRVKAKTEIHHLDLVSLAFWKKLKGESMKAYQSQLIPGMEISDPKEAFLWPKETEDQFFAVLRFIPESIEVLQLDGTKHLRILFSRSLNWKGQWLVP